MKYTTQTIFSIIICTICTSNAFARTIKTIADCSQGKDKDILNSCMCDISTNKDFIEGTNELFKDVEINAQNVSSFKPTLMNLTAQTLLKVCINNLSSIIDKPLGKVWIERDGKTYAFQFNMDDLFSYYNVQTSIMVYNEKNLKPGDKIKFKDIKKIYWSEECSDHNIWENLDDDAAVNIAGQKVFSQYGGSDNEYFLDFEKGNNNRAFPGFVLVDYTSTTKEGIIAFSDLSVAAKTAKNFATELSGTPCSNDGLVVYVVEHNAKQLTADRDLSIAPVWGFVPKSIASIKEVTVLAGPYLIR